MQYQITIKNINKMKQIVISVPNMQSTHYQTRVNNLVKDIGGVQIQNLEVGKLTVFVASDKVKEEVVQAIEKASYAVSLEDNSRSSDCSIGCYNK